MLVIVFTDPFASFLNSLLIILIQIPGEGIKQFSR